MAGIKLGKLPDRTPVKLTISVLPDLKRSLEDYSIFYGEAYGESEAVAELVPAILAGFIDGDRDFAKWLSVRRKEG